MKHEKAYSFKTLSRRPSFKLSARPGHSRLTLLRKRSQAHLAYIRDQRERLVYGGIVQGPQGVYGGIVYVLSADDAEDAEAFVSLDPYKPLYARVSIRPFEQRFPSEDFR